MDLGTLIGIIGGTAMVLSAILLKASLDNFIDPAGLLIVFGGTTAANRHLGVLGQDGVPLFAQISATEGALTAPEKPELIVFITPDVVRVPE